MTPLIRKLAKTLLPAPALERIKRYRRERALRGYEKLSTQAVFEQIYADEVWGKSKNPDSRYYSGSGSHDPIVSEVYINSVRKLLESLPKPPDVVDLGCGDFAIGAQLRPLCGAYVACDIARPLIEFNRDKFQSLDVEFLALDIATDALPSGDVDFLRQVLQHLSNDQIARVLASIVSTYKHVIITEHVPDHASFTPNVDKITGPDIRAYNGSGIVLTKEPFNISPRSERVLCEIQSAAPPGLIRTIAYEF